MNFSKVQIESYVAEGGAKCPHCGSEELEASNQVFTDHGIFFDCECVTCLREWKEHYKLDGILPKDETEVEPEELV